MSNLFLFFIATVVIMLVAGFIRYLPSGYKMPSLVGLAAWIVYGGMLGYGGVIANTALLPPGLFYLLAPIIMFIMFMARPRIGLTVALSFPLWLMMGMESLRLVRAVTSDSDRSP
ncbi:MAG TPA: hypothetical protein VGK14_05785 [Novimethylophilus sp.]|jgi:hypothetical protein|uniref:hypothetical protein n=1 Tax=Novimethylophilus sp. TaxID=2137426 RepID=UPI002F3F35E9